MGRMNPLEQSWIRLVTGARAARVVSISWKPEGQRCRSPRQTRSKPNSSATWTLSRSWSKLACPESVKVCPSMIPKFMPVLFAAVWTLVNLTTDIRDAQGVTGRYSTEGGARKVSCRSEPPVIRFYRKLCSGIATGGWRGGT